MSDICDKQNVVVRGLGLKRPFIFASRTSTPPIDATCNFPCQSGHRCSQAFGLVFDNSKDNQNSTSVLASLSETMMKNRDSGQMKNRWTQMGLEEKKEVIHEELKRMNKLPANSSYASHRLRVLNKILQLIAIQRTASQEEELELLFGGLSL